MASLLENIQQYIFLTKKQDQKELTPTADTSLSSFSPPTSTDGENYVVGGGVYAKILNLDTNNSNEKELIKRYREASRVPEVSDAIDEIVNEMIAQDDEGNIIKLDLENVEFSESVKNKIHEEFKEVLYLFEFDRKGSDYLRRWYVDGRLYFDKIIDTKSPADGIKELRYINPTTMKKVVETDKVKENGVEVYKTKKEYFTYVPSNKLSSISLAAENTAPGSIQQYNQQQVLAVSPERIAYITSGVYDEEFGTTLSHLHTALKAVNQLKTLEDALIIYRLSRAPERRIFYIDVGNLPKQKAEQYMRDIMAKFKNQVSYDSATGEIKDARRHLNMMEDFWIPRRSDGKATEITTLPGGQNLGELQDVEYFMKKVYKSLKVPASRLMNIEGAQPFAGIGRSAEISRDEIKFQKFIDKLRRRFELILLDVLKTQLKLKKIVSDDDWKLIERFVKVEWSRDNFQSELKEMEILKERLGTLQMVDPYVGKYFTREQVLKDILRYDEEKINNLYKETEQERKDHPDFFAPPEQQEPMA